MVKSLIQTAFPTGEERKLIKIQNYFKPYPYWRPALSWLGIGTILFWYIREDFTSEVFWLGVILLAAGIFLTLSHAYRRATASEMTAWFHQAKEALKEASLKKFNVNSDEILSEPVCITAPAYCKVNAVPDHAYVIKVNRQKQCFFGVYNVIWIMLTKEYMDIFQYRYNFLKDKIISEFTAEYYYRDIEKVTLGEQEINCLLPKNKLYGQHVISRLTSGEIFTLQVENGDTLTVLLKSKAIDKLLKIKTDISDNIETIEKIRNLTRERKATAQS